MPIMQTQRRENMVGQILPVAGSLVGGFFGGPGGAAAGGTLGSTVAGGMQGKQPPQLQAPESSAMTRRMQQMGPQGYDPMQDENMIKMQQAQEALAQQSPEMQQKYGPMLNGAMQKYQAQYNA